MVKSRKETRIERPRDLAKRDIVFSNFIKEDAKEILKDITNYKVGKKSDFCVLCDDFHSIAMPFILWLRELEIHITFHATCLFKEELWDHIDTDDIFKYFDFLSPYEIILR